MRCCGYELLLVTLAITTGVGNTFETLSSHISYVLLRVFFTHFTIETMDNIVFSCFIS